MKRKVSQPSRDTYPGRRISLSNLKNSKPLRSNVALGTKTVKTQNEDYGESYEGKLLCCMVMADGLGSSVDAHIAAKLAATKFLEEVRALESNQQSLKIENVMRFWESAAKSISKYFDLNKHKYEYKQHVLETTLVTLIEVEDRYFVSYLGNGSIWHIRGDFWRFGSHRWPWCISDIMLGHSFPDANGKDSLGGVLSINGASVNCRLLSIMKDTQCGEMFLLTTDGISSSDHLKTGRDENNKLWIEINPHIETLLKKYLLEYFRRLRLHAMEGSQVLKEVLQNFLNDTVFDDDATVGVLVSSKTIEHYLSCNLTDTV